MGNGQFAIKGPKEVKVTQTSAESIDLLVRDISHLPSDTDHRGLVRFEDAHDNRYQSLLGRLKRMVAAAELRDTPCTQGSLVQMGGRGNDNPGEANSAT